MNRVLNTAATGMYSQQLFIDNIANNLANVNTTGFKSARIEFQDLIRKSMSMRVLYNENNPKYHLNSWDAGWAQLKPMFKEYFKEDYDRFVVKYKEFENRMRKGVYKFGFLKE